MYARHDDMRRIARCRQIKGLVVVIALGQSVVAFPGIGAN